MVVSFVIMPQHSTRLAQERGGRGVNPPWVFEKTDEEYPFPAPAPSRS